MKKYSKILAYCCFVLMAFGLQAQVTVTKICYGSPFCNTVSGYRGAVQWQQSANGTNWSNVSGATSDTLCIVADTNVFFRAEIIEGTCAPIYSQVRAIEVSRVIVDAGQGGYFCPGVGMILGGSPTASGGVAPYTYNWFPSADLSSTTVANPVANPPTQMVYTVAVTDSLGCSGVMNVGLAPSPAVIADAGTSGAYCSNSTVTLGGTPAGSGGWGTLSYSWSPTTNLSAPNVPNPTTTLTVPAQYMLTVTDSMGCVGMDTIALDTGGTASTGTVTFAYTGSVQNFVVPACVSTLTLNVSGAQGGAAWVNNDNFGGQVIATIAVTPGEVLHIYVGEQPATGTAGGWNGGGAGDSGGRGGGGGSDVRRAPYTLNDRLVVGGGGGGAGYWSSQHVIGGKGGGLTGGDGMRVSTANMGGLGASQTGPGANGTCINMNVVAMAGAFGIGGTPLGSNCGCEGYGGGGGWYGGAGSGNCRGGGGGSGYAIPSATNTTFNQGTRTGNGQVIISW